MSSNSSYYESLLHSLQHEHTKGNIERHILSFEKWCRKFNDGIYICDLDYVITLIEILEERIKSHFTLFEPILLSFFQVCSKALLEAKGNERLRTIGMERIRKYFFALSRFSQTGNLACRSACIKMFRCILNAGIDPTIITDEQPIKHFENSAQVTDKIYIQNLMRESGSVQIISIELYKSYLNYSNNLKEIRNYQNQLNHTIKKKKKVVYEGDFDDGDDDENNNYNNMNSPTLAPNTSEPSLALNSISSYDPDDLPNQITSESNFNQLKEMTFEYGNYCKLLFELCLEISVDNQSACILCYNGYVCNALIIAISEELLNTRSDHSFISKLIELLWNCLESYVSIHHSGNDINNNNININNNKNNLGSNISLNNQSLSISTINPSILQGYTLEQINGIHNIIQFHTAIPTLKLLLRKLIFNGYCNSDKEIRNEVIIICNLLLSFPKSIPYFIHSGLLNDLVTFATYGEMGRKGWTFYSQPLPKLRNFSTFNEIDIQLKKELWLIIGELLAYDDQDIITCVASSSFLNVLFHYLEQSSFDNENENENIEINDSNQQLNDEIISSNGDDNFNNHNNYNNNKTPTGIQKSILNKTVTLTGTLTSQLSNNGNGNGDNNNNNNNNNINEDQESSSLGSFSTQHKKKSKLQSSNGKKHNDQSKLPLTQLLEIQILAMSILAGNAHRMMAEFIQIDGPRRALSILCQYSSSQVSDHKTLVYHTFLLLNRCLMSSNYVNRKLIELNGIEIFLYYFDNSDDNVSRAQSVKLLTVMCQSSIDCQNQFRNLGGIECLVKALIKYNERKIPLVGKLSGVKFVTLHDNDGEYPLNDENGGEMNVFAISLLSCIWKAVISNKVNEIIFAEKEGLDALFDMLEVSSFLIRSMILRLLSDLLQNRRLVTYAYAWRSHRTVRSIGQLLAHCWMDEEVRLNCTRGQDGVICNLWNILGNHTWPIESLPPELVFSDTGELMASSTSLLQQSQNNQLPSPPNQQQQQQQLNTSLSGIGLQSQSELNGQSQIVKRLNSAILASRAGTSTQIQSMVRSKVLLLDLRGIITAIYQSLGFLEVPVVNNDLIGSDDYLSYVYDEVSLDKQETKPKSGRTFLRSLSSMGADTKPVIISEEDMSDQNLSPTDKQVISICMRYDTLREGEWWNDILTQLKNENIIPIDADLNMIEDMKERVFASSRAIQYEQMELSVVRLLEKQSEEDVFFNHIIQQKNQQIKSEYLKRKSGRKN